MQNVLLGCELLLNTKSFSLKGLGLSICKQLVELFHGRIQVRSMVGYGTSFYFSIKLQVPSPSSSLHLSPQFLPRISTQSILKLGNISPREPANIVILSDSPDFVKVANNFLRTIGFLKISLLEYRSMKELEEVSQNLTRGPRVGAVLLYCTSGETIEAKGLMAKNLSLSDNIVLISPGLTQPIRKNLVSMGIRHLSPPLSEAKLRRYLASLLFSSDVEEDGNNLNKSAGTDKASLLEGTPESSDTCIAKEKQQNRTINVLAVEVSNLV